MKSGTAELAEASTGSLDNPEKKTMTQDAAEAAISSTEQLEDKLRGLFSSEAAGSPEKTGEEPQPDADEGEPENLEQGETGAEEQEAPEARAEWPESAQRRVDKLTAQKAELKENLTAAQAEKEALEAKVQDLAEKLEAAESGQAAPQPTADDPLAFITNQQQLAEYVGAVKQRLRNIEDYFDETLDDGQRVKGVNP